MTIADNFWSYVKKSKGCWEWTASKTLGYGQFAIRGQKTRVKAHRYSYELANGPIPKGLGVLHKCDNPACVRPSHLFLGDQKKNMEDASKKGRIPRGKDRSNAKLTEFKVATIKKLCARGKPQSEIAKLFSINQSTVSRINASLRWAHTT